MPIYHPDRLLIAKPDMVDANFVRTVIYVMEHDAGGALGVVLNRPTTIAVDEHFAALAPLVTYPSVFFEGGPVASGSVVAVGGRVGEPACLVNVDDLLEKDAKRPDQIRLFAGYSGWAAGQLEEELLTGSWITADTRRGELGNDDIFGANPADLWRAVLRRQPRPISQMALYPDDLMVN